MSRNPRFLTIIFKNFWRRINEHLHQHMKSPWRRCRKRRYTLSPWGCGDEEVLEMTAISSSFEQTMLLIGQALHSVTYYRRRNILPTLIDNPSKVKELLKDPDMALNNVSNTCLLCDKFEEKLLKDTNVKQKSILIFSGLQGRSSNNSSGTLYNNQPFRGSSLPRFSASSGRGHFFRAASQRGKEN